jgi:predicted ester cyclase
MGNIDTHRASMEAFNRRDFEGAAGPMREDATYTDHARGVTVKGPLEAMDNLKGWAEAFSDGQATELQFIDGGDHTACLFHARGTNDGPLGPLPATGKRVDVPFCEVMHYDAQGKITSAELFYDNMTMLVQLGHMQPVSQG